MIFVFYRTLAMIDDANLDQREIRANWPAHLEWRTEFSWTILIYAVQAEHFDTVRRLVERGANVNLRAEDGSTAASIAYENGMVSIYDYLRANGAIAFEPRQSTQQSTTPTQAPPTTIINVQPAAPAPAQTQQSAPQPPRLTSGFYWNGAVSGSMINLIMVHGSTTGTAFHSINNTNTSQGNFSMNGDQLIITWFSGPLNGLRSVYRIDNANQFSGSGEVWRK